MRCLVLDDDPAVRRAIAMCVRREGHEVVEAASAVEAIAIVNSQAIDLAFLDWNLGGPLTGSAVARACLRRSIPWTMVSAWTRDDILEGWKVQNPLAGMIEFIEKPIGDGDSLRAVLTRVERSREVTPPHGLKLPKNGDGGE